MVPGTSSLTMETSAIDELVTVVQLLCKRINEHRDAFEKSETLTRYALIDPLLRALGWDTADPAVVLPEYRVGGGRADYALLGNDAKPQVMVEAKKLGASLHSGRQQGIQYCIEKGTPYFLLTDGQHWQVFEPHKQVPVDEKLIVSFDLCGQSSFACKSALAIWRSSVLEDDVRSGPTLAADTRDQSNPALGRYSSTVSDHEQGTSHDTSNDRTPTLSIVNYLPLFSHARHLLRILPGWQARDVTGLLTTVHNRMGTPQNPVDWKKPVDWIPQILQGPQRDLAEEIWKRSKRSVNPRFMRDNWSLIRRHELLVEKNAGGLQISSRGEDFLELPGGKVENRIDEIECVSYLLSVLASRGPVQRGRLLEDWSAYLVRHTTTRARRSIESAMAARLKNLLERRLVERNGSRYSITQKGLANLKKK